ncbi:MAG: hypothetical protein F6J93_36445 [Oscillatoria sp. SIO1A7]|nr:hypothetical protein [Oscillatoria sp. SIO1A7]
MKLHAITTFICRSGARGVVGVACALSAVRAIACRRRKPALWGIALRGTLARLRQAIARTADYKPTGLRQAIARTADYKPTGLRQAIARTADYKPTGLRQAIARTADYKPTGLCASAQAMLYLPFGRSPVVGVSLPSGA